MPEIIIVKNEAEAGEIYGRCVADLIKAKPDAVLGLATGSSPLAAYQALAKIVKDEAIDVSGVRGLIGAAGVGKTANFLYPNMEYACAAGMSFISTDTKGDLFRTYGSIAEKYYGYHIGVIDLRNPTRSHGNNLLHLVNKYMDLFKENPENIAYKAKAEKYAKIIAKTVITSMGEGTDHG